jgi:hypothetical protein
LVGPVPTSSHRAHAGGTAHEVFRRAAQSRIIINAHRISQGPPGTDDLETAVSRIVELVKTRFRLDAIRDLQVLCPMNRRERWVRGR